MSEQPPSWSDLNPTPQASHPDRKGELCAIVFTTPAGKELLSLLRAKHIDRSFNPLADERALRVMATEQHFVRELELARDRGLAATANRKPKA